MTSLNLNKTTILLQQNKKLFHTQDLALLWQIGHRPTLRVTISRYLKKGILIPVQRGLYSTIPLDQLDPLELGSSALHAYCYLSTGSILFQAGIINQPPQAYTFCSPRSATFSLAGHHYHSRQLATKYLYHPLGIVDHTTHRQATPERAAADLLYFNPSYYLDAPSQLDQTQLSKIQEEVYQQ
ncbi:MAG: hypothetical protein ABIJ22_02700 [Patescibacteria group bacterium]